MGEHYRHTIRADRRWGRGRFLQSLAERDDDEEAEELFFAGFTTLEKPGSSSATNS